MASRAAHEQLESGVFTRDTLHTLAQALPGSESAGEADEEHGDIDSARERDVDEEADEDLDNDDDDVDEEDEDVGADEDENEDDDVLRDAQHDPDDESDGGETGLDGLAQSALEMLTEKEGKESADEWGRHRAFDGATPDDAQMSPEVHAFLQSLPRLPDIRGVSLPKKLMIFFSALEDFYELAPDPMLDMEAHGMAARTFAGAISGIVAARVDYKLRNVIARIVDFICQALISAHKDLSNPNLLGSLTYLELWLRGLDRRNQLAAVFPPFKESLAKINSNIQRLRREQNEEKNAAKANQDISQTAVSPAILAQLSTAVADLVLALQPTPEDIERRDTVIADMRVALSPENLQRALESVRDDVPAGLLSDTEQGAPVGVEIFGSAASGLNFRASADIDFSLVSVAERLANFQGDQRGAAVAEERTHSRAIAIAALALSASPKFAIQDVILTSRVPIVKCVHIASGLACDVASGNSIALQNTQLLRAYSEVDPRARSLIYAVKFWAKRRGICDASLGTLSSYAWTLMVIFFLQQTRDRHPTGKSKRSRKANNKQASSRREKRRGHIDSENTKDDASTGNDGNDDDGSDAAVADEHSESKLDVVYRAVLPNLQAPALLSKVPRKLVMMNGEEYDATFVRTAPPDFPVDANAQGLGELLVQFFAFYAYEFNMRRDVVSVRLGFPARRGTLGGPYSQADWRLAIEDPFERQHDLGSKISSKDAMTKIHEELARAAQMFRIAQGTSLIDAEVMQAPVQMPAFPRRCFNCGSAQHRSAKCAIGDLRSLGDKVCHLCGEFGHLIRDCPSSRGRRKRGDQRNDRRHGGGGGGGGGGDSRACFVCGKPGHLARDCPQKQQQQQQRASGPAIVGLQAERGRSKSSNNSNSKQQQQQQGQVLQRQSKRQQSPNNNISNNDNNNNNNNNNNTRKQPHQHAKQNSRKHNEPKEKHNEPKEKHDEHTKKHHEPKKKNKDTKKKDQEPATQQPQQQGNANQPKQKQKTPPKQKEQQTAEKNLSKPEAIAGATADKSNDTVSDGKVADKGNNKRKNKKKKPTSAETGGDKKGGGASQRVCRDWIAGDCSYGSRCKFYHPEKDHHPPGF